MLISPLHHLYGNVHVYHRAGRTVFAEASVIPGTVFNLGLRIYVQERTFLVATLACGGQHTHINMKHSERIQSLSSSVWFYEAAKSTNQTWSRSSIQAFWSCRIRGGTRTGLPSCTVLWASAYTPPSSLRWCDGTDTSHLGVETKKKKKSYSTADGTALLVTVCQSKQLPELCIFYFSILCVL